MRSPFPGMDPYLEHPYRWHPFHTQLVVRLGDAINEVLPEHYYASVEERTYIVLGDDPEEVQLPNVLVVGGGAARSGRAGSAMLEPSGMDSGKAMKALFPCRLRSCEASAYRGTSPRVWKSDPPSELRA